MNLFRPAKSLPAAAYAAVFLALFSGIFSSSAAFASYSSVEIANQNELGGDVYDGADLLSYSEENRLKKRLARIEEDYECDVAVVTLSDTNGYNLDEYAKALYKRCGYGCGSASTGVLFVISMGDREWDLLTYGNAISIFSDYDIDSITDEVVPLLSSGDYYEAFAAYAELSEDILSGAVYDRSSYNYNYASYSDSYDSVKPYLLSFGAAFVIALVICCGIAASMKKISAKRSAAGYMESGSFHLTDSHDYYLYTTKTRVRRQTDNNGPNGMRGGGRGSSFGGGHSGGGHGGGFGGSRGRF